MIEQLETSKEELQSINEEYQSTIEELQASELSIRRSIIEAHSGRMLADVDPLSGATLHFTLPVTIT